MQFSQLTDRIGGEGVAAWDLHEKACLDSAAGKDVIILSVGDPDFATPKPIVEQAIAALYRGETHYEHAMGRLELRDLIAKQYQSTCSVNLSSENVMMFSGAQNALFSTSLCLLNTGDDVLVLDPMYVTYEATLRASGANLVSVIQPAENGFRLDAEAVRASITEKTKVMLITNPNNPTGVLMSYQELQQICEIALENDLWVISDEVYSNLVFDGEFHNIAHMPGMFERTVTINSLSKSFAMTGWRVGWAVGPKELMKHFSNLSLCMLYGLSGFTQAAAYEAIAYQTQATVEIREIFRNRRDLVFEALSQIPKITVLKPQAGMFLMMDVHKLGLRSLEFANQLYQSTGVALLDAGAFGKACQGWVRISFTLDEQQLSEACHRICQFVEKIKSNS